MITVVILVFIGYIIYQATNFSLFEVKIKKITEISVPNKAYKIALYYVPGNATAQNVIQVKQILNNKKRIIENYENYNFVNNYQVLNNNFLKLVLSDTLFPERHPDTILLKLPSQDGNKK